MKIVCRLITVALLLVSMTAMAERSPIVTVQNTLDKFIIALNKNQSAIKRNPRVSHRLVRRIILPMVDIYTMGRSVVGRVHWAKATKKQRRRFVKAFTNLVLNTYERAFVEYTFNKVKVYPVRGGYEGKRRIKLHSTVYRKKAPPIDLSYRMVFKKKVWKIYDLSVEGISLVQSYRSQFSGPLAKGGIENLIREITNRKKKS